MTESNVAVYNLLDKDKLPNLEVKQRDKAIRSILTWCLDWFSIFVDAVFLFPVIDDVGYAFNSERSIIFILFLVTALNAVIVSRAGLDVNDLKPFILIPDV